MRVNRVKSMLAAGQAALGGWLSLPSAAVAETLAQQQFDWLCIDMQHALIDYRDAVDMIRVIAEHDVVPVVRVPSNEAGVIGRMLDAGALGVIIPMVNSPEEAAAAVAACRYAPAGVRSFGPGRARALYGSDYYPEANAQVLCMPMIETKEAVERIDDILDVPGIDVAFVGPVDLSITLGLPARLDNEGSFGEARRAVASACERHGIAAGIAGAAPVAAERFLPEGYRFIPVTSDVGALAAGANGDLEAARAVAEATLGAG